MCMQIKLLKAWTKERRKKERKVTSFHPLEPKLVLEKLVFRGDSSIKQCCSHSLFLP